jgi:hypothetical protein
MNMGLRRTIPVFSFLSVRKRHLFALALVFSMVMNSLCPRAIIELKNYDVVVLAMGSQSVFLHLFALPSKVSIELANLLFSDQMQSARQKSGHENKDKGVFNSSSDFSLLRFDEKQAITQLQPEVFGTGNIAGQSDVGFTSCQFIQRSQFHSLVLYFVFMMLFFSRPRGNGTGDAINMTPNNIVKKPGLDIKPGFLCFTEALL